MATLTKEEKRTIRLQIGGLLDQCAECEIISQNRQIYGVNEAYRMCFEICEIGKKIRELGKVIDHDNDT